MNNLNEMSRYRLLHVGSILAAGIITCSVLASGQSTASPAPQSQAPAAHTSAPAAHASAPAVHPLATPHAQTPPANRTRYTPIHFPKKAQLFYQNVWGIDSLAVRAAESGELIRFNYRVLDPAKAKQLNDKKNEPSLIAPTAGVKLVIPSLEKVGQLRQSIPPEEGKVYWMAFSNPRRIVKPGDRVNVVIGNFHADGLIVE